MPLREMVYWVLILQASVDDTKAIRSRVELQQNDTMLGFWVFASAITLLCWLMWRLHFTPERKIIDKLPGPPAIPFIGNVLQFAFLDQKGFMRLLVTYAKKYYPVYRTWTLNKPMIHISDPRHAEIFLGNNHNIKKSKDYKFISEWLGTGLLTSGGTKWHSRRKMLTPTFHFQILEQFVPIFSGQTKILISKLRQFQNKPEGVDIVPLVTMCALDIICETAMGISVGAQEDGKSPYVAAIHEINLLLMYRMLRPWLYPGWVFNLSGVGRQQKRCLNTLHGFTSRVIRERRAELKSKKSSTKDSSAAYGAKKKTAFLDLLIGMSEDGGNLTDEDIREEVDTFMFEGHDTTSAGISWALFYLASNPNVQAKCAEEMSEIFSGSDRTPTLTDLGSMKYLERVIKETLRLRPSVYTIARELDTTVNMDGYAIPPRTDVQIDIFNIHRHPEHWPDPERFDPDRFLPENIQGRHPYAYVPFSGGPRNCIGQKFAMLEEKSVISTVLRHFELRALDPARDQTPLPDLILRPEHGLTLRILPRNT